MIEEGALEDVEAIFAVHISHLLQTSVIGSRSGPLLAGCGFFKAVITSNGNVHHSSDLVLAASAAVISLQGIISRESNPLDSQVGYNFENFFASELLLKFFLTKEVLNSFSQVVSVTFMDSGEDPNASQKRVIFGVTLRAFSNASFHQLLKRIEEVCHRSICSKLLVR